jgi:hypothetical protein
MFPKSGFGGRLVTGSSHRLTNRGDERLKGIKPPPAHPHVDIVDKLVTETAAAAAARMAKARAPPPPHPRVDNVNVKPPPPHPHVDNVNVNDKDNVNDEKGAVPQTTISTKGKRAPPPPKPHKEATDQPPTAASEHAIVLDTQATSPSEQATAPIEAGREAGREAGGEAGVGAGKKSLEAGTVTAGTGGNTGGNAGNGHGESLSVTEYRGETVDILKNSVSTADTSSSNRDTHSSSNRDTHSSSNRDTHSSSSRSSQVFRAAKSPQNANPEDRRGSIIDGHQFGGNPTIILVGDKTVRIITDLDWQ